VGERGGFEILLNVFFLRLYWGPGQELADLVGACAECFRCIPRGDDAVFEGGSDEREHPSGEAFERMHVEVSHVCTVDWIAQRAGESAGRDLGEPVEGGAVDEAFLEQADSDCRVADPEVPLEVHHGGWIGRAVPRCVLGYQPSEFVAGDEEFASERIGEALSNEFRAGYRDDDVKVT
jgi:hypothetical protein